MAPDPCRIEVNFPPELAEFVRKWTGPDDCRSDVIVDAVYSLRKWFMTPEALRDEVVARIQEGLDQAERGECEDGDVFFARLKAELEEMAPPPPLLPNQFVLFPDQVDFVDGLVDACTYKSRGELVSDAVGRLRVATERAHRDLPLVAASALLERLEQQGRSRPNPSVRDETWAVLERLREGINQIPSGLTESYFLEESPKWRGRIQPLAYWRQRLERYDALVSAPWGITCAKLDEMRM